MPSVEKKDGVQHWGSFPAGQTSASDRGTTRNPGVGDGKKGGGLRVVVQQTKPQPQPHGGKGQPLGMEEEETAKKKPLQGKRRTSSLEGRIRLQVMEAAPGRGWRLASTRPSGQHS
ncbi:hypothetical protein QTO34_001755 [Cnephaeus nilssonii]|uniref:Uncharacterized protein n=1 Tax=Cnephaeus nilssonii TaxID=3371016 RepID=A0AA40HTN0_CNENI|nr:hypothetical protein QTO34_001755 [Eptesicus nilssonii]